jgi:hypothetical protein
VAAYLNARHLHLLNTFPGLVPPILLSVPALVVLTLFCRSRSDRWQAEILSERQPGSTQPLIRLIWRRSCSAEKNGLPGAEQAEWRGCDVAHAGEPTQVPAVGWHPGGVIWISRLRQRP